MLDIERFRDQGYLVLRDVIDHSLLEPFIDVLRRRVDDHARALNPAGPWHADLPFERRLGALHEGRDFIMRVWNSSLFSEEFRDLVCSPALTGPITELLGPEVTFQGNAHLRPYLSRHLDRLPWHQDAQFYEPGIEHMLWNILQVWLPLVDVGVDSGCMALVPGSHHWGLIDPHGRQDDPEQVYQLTAHRVRFEPVHLVPMRKGDLLVFTNLLAHTGTENRSGTVRWSVDLRFERTLGSRPLTEAERLGYEITHRRMASRNARPLRVASAAGPESWNEWRGRGEHSAHPS